MLIIGCLEKNSSGGGFSLGLEVGGLGKLDLRGVLDWDWKSGDVDWSGLSDNGDWSNWGWSNWKVGGSDSESVDIISNIVYLLDESVGIDVAVSSTGNSIGGLDLRLGAWATSVSVRVLSELILSVVLASGDGWGTDDWGSSNNVTVSKNWGSDNWGSIVGIDNAGGGAGQNGRENNEGLHFGF